MSRVNLPLYGGVVTIWMRNRSATEVITPPPCEKMKLMSPYRPDAPLKIRLTSERVVSAPQSTAASGTPLTRLTQQLGLIGWVYTTALRRFSSSNTGPNFG